MSIQNQAGTPKTPIRDYAIDPIKENIKPGILLIQSKYQNLPNPFFCIGFKISLIN
jgi:hypothetical protein